MLPGFFLIAAFGLAILALIKNLKTTKEYSRQSFLITLVLVSLPLLMISVGDFARLGERLVPNTDAPNVDSFKTLGRFLPIYLLFVAYPFFQRVCWRASDASVHKAVCYMSLVPYLNVLIFAYLCIKPTSLKTVT